MKPGLWAQPSHSQVKSTSVASQIERGMLIDLLLNMCFGKNCLSLHITYPYKGNIFSLIKLLTIFWAVFMPLLMVLNIKKN